MRAPSHLVVLAAAAAALLAAAAIYGGTASAQPPPGPVPTRIATADIYAVVEQLLKRDEYKKTNDELKAKWTTRLEGLQKEISKLESDLQVVPQSDPKYQDIFKVGQTKQAEFDRLYQDQLKEFESLSSKQLIDAYGKARDALNKIADAKGYSHVLATRSPDRVIQSTNLGNALQELLARPVVKCPPGDDLTKALADEMKVTL